MQVATRTPAPGDGRSAPAHAGPALPHGFIPVEAVKALPMMGRWAPLPDGLPPWLPFHALVEMAAREQAGDAEAREWLDRYRRAVQGDAAAQRAMGHACEHGCAGLPADVQRAFFWYYRAGLGGDEAATDEAIRLKDAHDIASAAMQEPELVYAGQWRLRCEDSARRLERVVMELHEDGRSTGLAAPGLWSFDRVRRVLTLAHRETWRVRIVACRESMLFGLDARGTGCTLERVGPVRESV